MYLTHYSNNSHENLIINSSWPVFLSPWHHISFTGQGSNFWIGFITHNQLLMISCGLITIVYITIVFPHCSRSRYGLYHSRCLRLKGLSEVNRNSCSLSPHICLYSLMEVGLLCHHSAKTLPLKSVLVQSIPRNHRDL